MESILHSIKKLLGITSDYTVFDPEIIMHINSVFSTLTQLGVGPEDGFSITDESSVWSDFIPEGNKKLECIKSYMYLKVKLLFDPPTNSATISAMNEMAREYEWRLNVSAEDTT